MRSKILCYIVVIHTMVRACAATADVERVGAATCLSQLLAQAEVHQTEQQRKRWRNAVIDIFRFPLTLVKT